MRWYFIVVFISISLIIGEVKYFFHIFVGHLYIIFREMSIQVLCLFLIGLFDFLLLNSSSSLYILDTNPLSGMWLANIFSHFIGCLFNLLMCSLMYKFLRLMSSRLYTVAFIASTFGIITKKSFQVQCQEVFPYVFF